LWLEAAHSDHVGERKVRPRLVRRQCLRFVAAGRRLVVEEARLVRDGRSVRTVVFVRTVVKDP
jgi:hypothetical protein